MIRSLMLAATAVTLVSAQALAADRPNVLYAKDTPAIPMAEWEIVQQGAAEQTGARILIAHGKDELAKAPANAVKYTSQAFRFATGDIRVLEFRKATGGVLHQVTTETALYVLEGSAVVNVGGTPTEVRAGDVVSMPSGVIRSRPNAAEDTTLVLHTVFGTPSNRKPAVVRAKDTPENVAGKPDAAKKSAGLALRRYAFDGNSVRVARLTGPGSTPPNNHNTDSLIYILDGPMTLTQGDEKATVNKGDALREVAGLITYWDVPRNGAFLSTSAGPLGASPAPAAAPAPAAPAK